MTKRVAFFIGEVYMDFQSSVYKGVCDTAKKLGIRVDVFSNFGVLSANYLQTMGEQNIINLPKLSLYDGIILAPDTLNIRDMMLDTLEKIKKESKCPMVCIRKEVEGYYNVLLDNVEMMESIVDHFIEEHGCKHICYMSGTPTMKDAQERLEGYRASMAKHGLEVTDNMIFHGNYWYGPEKDAINQFYLEKEKPDAIVCANDFMALAILQELNRRGIKVPEEVKVSGFDKVMEGQYCTPRLSTVETPGEEMGVAALELLAKVMNGEDAPLKVYCKAKPCRNESCGCKNEANENMALDAYNRVLYLKSSINKDLETGGDLENCETVEEVLLAGIRQATFEFENLYICLCVEEESEDTELSDKFTERCELRIIYNHAKGSELKHIIFERNEILPEEFVKGAKVLLNFPIHFRGHCMGYLVVESDGTKTMQEGFLLWLHNMSNYLDKAYTYEHNRKLLKYREESRMDSMTGLFNRRGMEVLVQKSIKKCEEGRKIYMMSVDMDGLKRINDTFGHAEGDLAIIEAAKILRHISATDINCARTGGDEFLVCLVGDEERLQTVLKRIDEYIRDYNEKNKRGYELSLSVGWAEYEPKRGIQACMKKADMLMYENKIAKKKARVE